MTFEPTLVQNNLMRATLLLLPLLETLPLTAERDCRDKPHFVGPCFAVHGRAWIAQGGPSLRIWHVGSKHFYGLRSDDPLAAPHSLLDALDQGNHDVYANFVLCPVTREIPHAMTMVCIKSVHHMIVTETNSLTRVYPRHGSR